MSEEKHEYTPQEMAAWREGKNRKRETPPDLVGDDLIQFVELVARDESSGVFEFQMGLGRREIAFYKAKYDVLTVEDARKRLRVLQKEREDARAKFLAEQQAEALKARRLAEKRLEELEAKKAAEAQKARQEKAEDNAAKAAAFKQEDAQRQRKFAAQQASAPDTGWRLPIESRDGEEEKKRFWNDITGRGMRFCREKYQCENDDIRSEACRLGLSIDWNMVRN